MENVNVNEIEENKQSCVRVIMLYIFLAFAKSYDHIDARNNPAKVIQVYLGTLCNASEHSLFHINRAHSWDGTCTFWNKIKSQNVKNCLGLLSSFCFLNKMIFFWSIASSKASTIGSQEGPVCWSVSISSLMS